MFTKDNIFFLDLEQTIIDSWEGREIINVGPIKRWLHANGADSVNIFSFAIWTDEDKQNFDQYIRPRIERYLELPILSWPSIEDMMRADFDHTGVHFDRGHERTEFINMRGKKDAFINYVLCKVDFKRAVLIDDVVQDITITHRKNGWTIELWNVDHLE
jgi:hypothetical protein